jgi:hypothetical protein
VDGSFPQQESIMVQSRTADAIPTSGHSETIDSSSAGMASSSDGGAHVTSYVGLAIAALILAAMVYVAGMWS